MEASRVAPLVLPGRAATTPPGPPPWARIRPTLVTRQSTPPDHPCGFPPTPTPSPDNASPPRRDQLRPPGRHGAAPRALAGRARTSGGTRARHRPQSGRHTRPSPGRPLFGGSSPEDSDMALAPTGKSLRPPARENRAAARRLSSSVTLQRCRVTAVRSAARSHRPPVSPDQRRNLPDRTTIPSKQLPVRSRPPAARAPSTAVTVHHPAASPKTAVDRSGRSTVREDTFHMRDLWSIAREL